jgi:hypothetical protein
MQAFKDSGCIIRFTFKLLNSRPNFLSSIDSIGTDTGYQISQQKKIWDDSNQVSVEARELESHVLDQSNIQDNLRTVTDTIHDCIVLEHLCAGTICKDAY